MNLSAVDLNLFLVLHTVLEEQSVARAAARLHVTPPAVSNALARLRALFGDPLLVRRGRGLVATPRAVQLAPHLGAAFAELERAAEESAAFDPARTRRRFVLACADADQVCSVPPIARAFARQLPLAQFQVASIDQLTASDGLANGTVDAAIAPPLGAPGLHAQPLYTDEAALVLRKGHPLDRAGARLSAAQFNALRHVDTWLVLGRPGVGHDMAEAFLRKHGLERQVALIVPTFSAAAMIAAATDLAASMPRRVAERYVQLLPLRVLALPSPPMRFQMQLVWHERTHQDPGAVHFRALVTAAIAGAPPAGAPPRKPRGAVRK